MAEVAEARAALAPSLPWTQPRSLLRWLACGSVDDGKSTLIGRLLYESGMIFDDHLTALADDSRRVGTRGGDLDFALLMDGLIAEREQGITIDVAYRYFSSPTRTFVVADAPGHEQYTRNMVTGASTTDLAVMLVDARTGVLGQTRRHSYLLSLLGIRHVVLAVNKMDLVGYARDVFARIEEDYGEVARRMRLTNVAAIPVVAVDGDNVVARGPHMPWYGGPTLLEYLNAVPVEEDRAAGVFRLPVQLIIRPNADFRGVAGLIAGGTVRVGDRVCVLPSGLRSEVTRILVGDADVESAQAGQSVALTLADDVDVSRGDVLAGADGHPGLANRFEATIVWLHEQPMQQGRAYLAKIGARTVTATVAPLKYKINVNTLEHVAAKSLDLNDIARCGLQLDRDVVFEPYGTNRELGGLILIDRMTNATVGAGLLHFALHRAHSVHAQALAIDKRARAARNGQKPCLVWLTGLSGAGKSTIANLVDTRLHAAGRHTYLLDGDNIRLGLNRDLGFTESDRVENVRRAAEVARLMVDAGLIVLACFISPFRAERRTVRELVGRDEFFEVFVDAPLDVAEARDPKGLYRKARRGELANFTGVDSPYEAPEHPELRIDCARVGADDAADLIVDMLRRAGAIDGV